MPHLSLHTGTPVTSIDYQTSSLTTSRGAVSCNTIVHATNGYSGALLPEKYSSLVTPTRGQVMATRANAPLTTLGRSSWSNGGDEYWFPRPVSDPEKDYPLVILGGARDASGNDAAESGIWDDSVINPNVSVALKEFLPTVFPDAFEKGKEPEMEWVCLKPLVFS